MSGALSEGGTKIREILITSLGIACVVGAGALIVLKVKELKLGEHSSRFVGAVVALVTYYWVSNNYFEGLDFWFLDRLDFTFSQTQMVVPVAMGLIAVWYLYRTLRNWKDEGKVLLMRSGPLLGTVGLLLASRVLFSV
jgi:hypothetical protein